MRHSMKLTTLETSTTLNQTNRPGFVSDQYAFIPSRAIIDTATSVGFEAVQVRQSKARLEEKRGFEKHQVIMRHSSFTEQDAELRLYFRNSHDRTSALQIDVGFFRFICENGLIVGNSLFPSIKVYHTGNQEIIQQRIFAAVTDLIKRIPDVMQLKRDMQALQLTSAQVSSLVSESSQVVSELRKATIESEQLLRLHRESDAQLDAWTLFNVVQENAVGSVIGYKTLEDLSRKRVNLRKVKDLDRDTKINKRLFDVFATQLNLKKVA